jgi:uncharacterized coiled-coil DUF342 family protein
VYFATEPLKLLLCDAQDSNSSRQVRVYLRQQAKKYRNNNNNNNKQVQVQAQDIRRLCRQAGGSKGCGKEEIVITRKEGSQEAQHFHWFFGFLTLNC